MLLTSPPWRGALKAAHGEAVTEAKLEMAALSVGETLTFPRSPGFFEVPAVPELGSIDVIYEVCSL